MGEINPELVREAKRLRRRSLRVGLKPSGRSGAVASSVAFAHWQGASALPQPLARSPHPGDNDLRNSNGVAAETRRVYKFSSPRNCYCSCERGCATVIGGHLAGKQ